MIKWRCVLKVKQILLMAGCHILMWSFAKISNHFYAIESADQIGNTDEFPVTSKIPFNSLIFPTNDLMLWNIAIWQIWVHWKHGLCLNYCID